eukprot:23120-Amphidinium_carterae.1
MSVATVTCPSAESYQKQRLLRYARSNHLKTPGTQIDFDYLAFGVRADRLARHVGLAQCGCSSCSTAKADLLLSYIMSH